MFKAKALLPTDPPAFCDLRGNFTMEIKYFQLPPNWCWVSDWMIDMNAPVDEQGWSYNESFTASSSWSPKNIQKRVSMVRRRKWTRMRRLKGVTSPVSAESDNDQISSISRIVQRKRIDREKIAALKKYLVEQPITDIIVVETVLNALEYDIGKLDACILLSTAASKEPKLFSHCLSKLKFYRDKLAFSKHLGINPF